MPYNIWCDGCKAHIAMGVRYNAEKKKVGMQLLNLINLIQTKNLIEINQGISRRLFINLE